MSVHPDFERFEEKIQAYLNHVFVLVMKYHPIQVVVMKWTDPYRFKYSIVIIFFF